MKCILMAWGQLKTGFEVLALCEMCFQGMGAVEKGGLGCSHWVKYVLRALGAVENGVGGVGIG